MSEAAGGGDLEMGQGWESSKLMLTEELLNACSVILCFGMYCSLL